MTIKNVPQNSSKRPGPIRSGIAAFVAAAFLWTNTGGLYAGENRFWQERRDASRKIHAGGAEPGFLLASAGPAGLSPEARTFLSTLPQVGNVPLSDQRNVDRSVSGLTSQGLPVPPSGSSPVWMKELLAYGDVGETYTSPKPGAPTVIHIQDAHGIDEAQKNISGLMGVLQETRNANLVGMEGASGRFTLDPFRKYPSQIVKDVAESILGKGLIGGPEYAGLTLPNAPTLFGVEEGKLYLDNVAALKTAYKERPRVTEALSKLQSAAEGLKNKRYSEGLKEYDRHVKAYSSGREDLGNCVHYLAQTADHREGKNKLTVPNVRLLLIALDWEKALDFKKVEADRLRLVEALVKVVSKPELDDLVARSVDYRAGRMGYGAYHRDLWDMCERNGIRLKEYGQVMSYINYILSSEKINRNALITELAILEERAQDDLVETADQGTLVGVSRRLALMEKLLHHEMSMADWKRYQAERAGVLRVKEELTALDPTLASLVALTETDVKPFEDFCSLAVSRNNALVTNLLTKMKSDSAHTGVLVAGGFHTEGITTLLRASDTSYVVVMPKISKVPAHSNYLDVLAKDPVPLDKLLAGEKIYLVHAARLADTPLGNDSLRPFLETLFEKLAQLFSTGQYSSDKLAYEASAIAGELAKEPSPFTQAITAVSAKFWTELKSGFKKVAPFVSPAAFMFSANKGRQNLDVLTLMGKIRTKTPPDILRFLTSFTLAVGAVYYSLVSVFLGAVPWVVNSFEQWGYFSSSWIEVLDVALAVSALFAIVAIVAARKILNASFSETKWVKRYSLAFLGTLAMIFLLPIGLIGSHLTPYPEVNGVKIVGSREMQERVIPFLHEFMPRHTNGLKILIFAPNGIKRSVETVKLQDGEITIDAATAGRYFGPIAATIGVNTSIYTESSDNYGLPPLIAHEIGHHVMMPVAGWEELYDRSGVNDFISYYASKNVLEDQAEVFSHYRMGTTNLVLGYYEGGSETIKAKIRLVAQQFIDQDPSTGLYYLTFYSSDAKPHRYILTGYDTKEAVLSNFRDVFEKMIGSKEFRGFLYPPSGSLQSVFGYLKWAKGAFSRTVVSLLEGIGEEAVFRGGMLLALSTVGLFHAFWILPAQALIFGLTHFWAERKLARSQGGELTFLQYLFSPSFGNHFLYGLRTGAVSFGLFFITGMMIGDALADKWVLFLVSLAPGSLHHFGNNLLVRMGFDHNGRRRLQSIKSSDWLRRFKAFSVRLSRVVMSLVIPRNAVNSPSGGAVGTTVDFSNAERLLRDMFSPRGPPDTKSLIIPLPTFIFPLLIYRSLHIPPLKGFIKDVIQDLVLTFPIDQSEVPIPAITDVFPANMTFGLEIEFHTHIQSGFPEDTVAKVNNALRRAGFESLEKMGSSLVEIRTPSGDSVLKNVPEDWQRLKIFLKELQAEHVPAGFYSVHMHVGKEGVSSADLQAMKEDIGRLAKAYEAFWRALSGRGFKKPSGSIRPLDAGDLVGTNFSVTLHRSIYNVSKTYPTLEAKTITGLLDAHGHLDVERLEEHLWFVFALFRAATEKGRQLPLALMGRPVVAGEKPSPQQTAAFLDHIYRGDPHGRTIAEKIFIGLTDEDQGFSEQELAEEQQRVKKAYKSVGLGILYDFHDRALGHIDSHVMDSLLKPRTLQTLANDLVAAGASNEQALSFFPPEMYGPLLLALNLQRERSRKPVPADYAIKKISLETLLGIPGRINPQADFGRWVRERVTTSRPDQYGEIMGVFNTSLINPSSQGAVSLVQALSGLRNVGSPIDSGAFLRGTELRPSFSPLERLDLSLTLKRGVVHVKTSMEARASRWVRSLIPTAIAMGVGILVHHVGSPPSGVVVPNAETMVIQNGPDREILFAYKENEEESPRVQPQGIDPRAQAASETMVPPLGRGDLVRLMLDRVRAQMGKPHAEFADPAGLIRAILKQNGWKSIDDAREISPDLWVVPGQVEIVSPAQRGPLKSIRRSPSQKSEGGRTHGSAGGTLRLLQRLGLAPGAERGRLGTFSKIGWFEGAMTGFFAPLVALVPALTAFGMAVGLGFDASGFLASDSWVSQTLVPAIGFTAGAVLALKVTEMVFFQLHKRTGIVGLDGHINNNPTDAEAKAATRTAMIGFWGAAPGLVGVLMFLSATTPGVTLFAVGLYGMGVVLAGAWHARKNDQIVQAPIDRHFSSETNRAAFDSALRAAATAPVFDALRATPPSRFNFLLPRPMSSRSKRVNESWETMVRSATLEKLAALIQAMPNSVALRSAQGNPQTVTVLDLAVIESAKNQSERKVLSAAALAEIHRAEGDGHRFVVVTHSALGGSDSLPAAIARLLELRADDSLPKSVSVVPFSERVRANKGRIHLAELLAAAHIDMTHVGVLQLIADPRSLDVAGIREEILCYITSLNVSEYFERSLRALEKEATFA